MRRHTDYENMVAAYHLLSSTERKELDAHVRECSACAADLAAYRQMDADLRALRPHRVSAATAALVNEAISAADATHAPARQVAGAIVKQPVVRQTKRPREPWTWSRALLPLGFILLFALAVGLSLPRLGSDSRGAALGQPVAAPPNQAEIVKLSFACDTASAFGNDGLWWKVIAAFEEANPDIEVDINAPITGTDADSYHQAIADMTERDDVFCAVPLVSDWQRGVVANLAPYIANDPEFNPDDFYPALWRPSEHGEVLSVPTYFRPMLMKYNPELFDRAGVPYPRPGWTWDDFIAAAKALTVREGGEVKQWGYLETVAGMFSVRLRSDLGADLKSLPDYATAANTLGWFERLYVDEPAAPNVSIPPSMGGKVYIQPFVNMLNDGKIAMTSIDLRSDREGSRHLAPYPEASYGVLSSYFSNLVMSGKTAHPDEAWRLLSYLSRHLPDGEVPARRSLAEQASFWQGLDDSSTAAYRYALDHLAAPVLSTPLPDGFKAYQDAAIAVALGEKTVEQALADLDTRMSLRGGPAERAAAAEVQAATPAQTVIPEIVTATPEPTPMARPADSTVLTFACYRNRLPYYADAVKAFEAANPGVYVDLKPFEDLGVQFGQVADTLQESLEGVAAQVDALCDDNLPTRVRTGEGLDKYRDLTPLIAADPSVDLSDYFEGALDPVQEGGRTWGLPRGLWITMIYYNQAAFRQAGLAQPQPGWTWDDFLAAAKALTIQKDDGSVRWGFTELWRAGTPFLRSRNPNLLAGGVSDLTSPDTQAALQWYVDLMRAHQVMPVPEWYQDEQYVGAVGKERALESQTAMYSGMGGGLILDSSNWRTLLGVVPLPVGALNDRTTPLEYSADALVMSAASRHPDETWRWLVTASKVVGLSEGRGTPARRSVLEAMRNTTRIDANVYAAYEYALTHLLKPARLAPQIDTALYDAIRAAAVDGKPVDVALREAAQSAD